MLQKIFNIKKLFQHHKPEAHVSMATVQGIRCKLHVANLALFGVVIMLTIASALTYYLMPVTDVSELSKIIEVQEEGTILDTESVDVDLKKEEVIENKAFSVISERNVFSHERKEWVVKAVIPKASELGKKKHVKDEMAKKALAKKKALAGKPKKIILHGVVISGSIKKALINNPLRGVSKKKTLYVEEGDELEGYKVTSIEKDRITLDWHGEEIVVLLYSGLKDFKQDDNARKVKPGGITKLDYKFKVDENVQVEEDFDVGDVEEIKVARADMRDETSFNHMYKEPEHFFMPVLGDAQLSEAAEKQEVAEILPDIKFKDIDFPEEEQEVVTKFDYKFKVDEDARVEEVFDMGDAEDIKVAHADVRDETSLNFMYKEPEYSFMPVLDDAHLSEAAEKQEVADILPDIKFKDIDFPEEELKVAKADIPKSVDWMAVGRLKQKAISGKPIEIVLHGIVIVLAKDIKKALVNIPMNDLRKDRTLFVEEGDRLEGYKVTSIEPDQLRLDWHGREMVVKFPPL